MDELIRNDGPDDRCFGCGHSNEHGLKLVFKRTGERSVEAEYTAPAHFCGVTSIVHGGIQATLLDEVSGMAVHLAEEGGFHAVTADFGLRFRRPVPVDTPLVVSGRVERSEDPNYFTVADIRGPDGEVLTTAESRWRRIS